MTTTREHHVMNRAQGERGAADLGDKGGRKEEAVDCEYLGDGGEVVVLDHVAEHDEHGEGQEPRHHLPGVHHCRRRARR